MLGNRRACSDEEPYGVGWSWESRERISCEACLFLCAVAEANSIPIPQRWQIDVSPGQILRGRVARTLAFGRVTVARKK
jgi:hypothetical protein